MRTLDIFAGICKTSSHENIKNTAKVPPPHVKNSSVWAFVIESIYPLIHRFPLFAAISGYLKKIIPFPGIWEETHLKKLVGKKYKSVHTSEKIAVVIVTKWTLSHLEKILENFNSDEYDLVYISFTGIESINNAKPHDCNVLSIQEVIKRKLYYKLALTTHVGYDGSMFNFGIEFIAEKSLFLASAIDTYFYKYINFEHYNYIVCAGEYQRKQFQSYITSSKLLVMGSPRFDNYKDDREAAERIIEHQTGIGIPRNKKNILWLPVHGKATTCIIFAPMLAKIQNEFNIILKPHPFIYYEIPNFENRIRSIIPEIIIIRNEDYINLFPAADFVICDYGGPVFSVIKADKNVLLFNIHKSELLGMTPDLPANVIRDRIINFYPEEEEKFFAALKDDDIWEKQKKIRRQIRAEFFTENPNSARDIADLCRRIVRGEA